jgi:hypothetical protein
MVRVAQKSRNGIGRLKSKHFESLVEIGAGDKNRTRDLMITNQLLYLLSYAGF